MWRAAAKMADRGTADELSPAAMGSNESDYAAATIWHAIGQWSAGPEDRGSTELFLAESYDS